MVIGFQLILQTLLGKTEGTFSLETFDLNLESVFKFQIFVPKDPRRTCSSKARCLPQNVHSIQQPAQEYQNLKQHFDKMMHDNRILVNENQYLLNIIRSHYLALHFGKNQSVENYKFELTPFSYFIHFNVKKSGTNLPEILQNFELLKLLQYTDSKSIIYYKKQSKSLNFEKQSNLHVFRNCQVNIAILFAKIKTTMNKQNTFLCNFEKLQLRKTIKSNFEGGQG